MRITPEYLAQNVELHQADETYGTSGWQYAEAVVRLVAELEMAPFDSQMPDILDYGAGKGTLGRDLARDHGIVIQEYDPAIEAIALEPTPADLVIVGDVLEHIEPMRLAEVLAHIHEVTNEMAYFVIGTRPASKTLPDGRNCHLIQKPAWWWANNLGLARFTIIDAGVGRKREAIFTAVPV